MSDKCRVTGQTSPEARMKTCLRLLMGIKGNEGRNHKGELVAAAKRIAHSDFDVEYPMHAAAVDDLVGEGPTAGLRAIDAAGVYSPPPVSQQQWEVMRW
jgi:hypothetical protein